MSTERFSLTAQGLIHSRLKTPYRDGTTHLVTVPAHRAAVVRNVIVSNPGTSAVCAQQILKGATVKLDVCVPAGSSFEAHFSPALYYTAGETVDFKNSDAVTATNVTVNFRIIPPGKGLIQNEE